MQIHVRIPDLAIPTSLSIGLPLQTALIFPIFPIIRIPAIIHVMVEISILLCNMLFRCLNLRIT